MIFKKCNFCFVWGWTWKSWEFQCQDWSGHRWIFCQKNLGWAWTETTLESNFHLSKYSRMFRRLWLTWFIWKAFIFIHYICCDLILFQIFQHLSMSGIQACSKMSCSWAFTSERLLTPGVVTWIRVPVLIPCPRPWPVSCVHHSKYISKKRYAVMRQISH